MSLRARWLPSLWICACGHTDPTTFPDATSADGDLASNSRDGATDAVADFDRAPSRDGGRDEVTQDATTAPDAAPRPLAPLSTSTVTSRRPTLRWALPTGADGARVELCLDRGCSRHIATLDALGSSVRPDEDLPLGVVYWRLRPRGVASTLVGPTWQFVVGPRSSSVDTSWGATFDLHGAGYADVIVGVTNPRSGRLEVYRGGPRGPMSPPDPALLDPLGSGGGYDVGGATSVGDVDGDGFADLAVKRYGPGPAYAYLYAGGLTGTVTAPRLFARATVTADYNYILLSAAGDVNRDGFADVLVHDRNVPTSADLYLGSATGIATTPAMTLSPIAPTGYRAITQMTSAGDVNGDGYGDVVLGVFDAVGPVDGIVYLYLGSPAGPAMPPQVRSEMRAGNSGFARTVASADWNGDGYSDLIVGGIRDGACVRVFFGGAAGVSSDADVTLTCPTWMAITSLLTGDFNGDGFSDVVLIGEVEGEDADAVRGVYLGGATRGAIPPSQTSIGPARGSGMSAVSFASAGDVNGDGFGDLVIGADNPAFHQNGGAYLYLGGRTGISTDAAAIIMSSDPEEAGFAYEVAYFVSHRRNSGAPASALWTLPPGASRLHGRAVSVSAEETWRRDNRQLVGLALWPPV